MFWNKRKKYDFYLAGKMRGCPELNRPMFIKVANLLRKMGFTVWSPAEHESYLKSSFAQCMTVDLNAVINQCNKIALLPGWRKSLGSNIEVFSAFACGKEAVEVIIEDNETIQLDPLDLNDYHLPYNEGERRRFDPHGCSPSEPEPGSLETPEDEGDACGH